MQFHDYQTIRNKWARDKNSEFGKAANRMKAEEFRAYVQNSCYAVMQSEHRYSAEVLEWHRWQGQVVDMEQQWVDSDRPFYCIWPVIVPLARSTHIDMPMSVVELPLPTLLLRFAKGHEPYGIGTAMLYWDRTDRLFTVHCHFANSTEGLQLSLGQYEPDQTFLHYLERALGENWSMDDWSEERNASCDAKEACVSTLKLAVFIALLAKGEDIITPKVLAKDQQKYEATDEERVKSWLEGRAARVMGRGFDVGKQLQEEQERSPHWRNPHFALFWTGPGRTVPVIKMRSGSIVQRASMADVPTGYLGPETEADDLIFSESTPREAFSKSKRFMIFKRDSYRCQICGSTQEGGAKLHVDHRIPLAKGGSNEDENLWTLCEACNLGKSDQDL